MATHSSILACTDNPMDRRAWWGGGVSALGRKESEQLSTCAHTGKDLVRSVPGDLDVGLRNLP